jgi:hypothetical protein
MAILLVTHSEDPSCDRACAELARLGYSVARVDVDRFPSGLPLAVSQGAAAPETEIPARNGHVRACDIDAVWNRYCDSGECLPHEMNDRHRALAVYQSQMFIDGWLASLPVFQLDPRPAAQTAELKLLQHHVATETGLEIPRTLVANDPEAVRRFAATCPTGVVAKMLQNRGLDDGETTLAVGTTLLSNDDLASLDGLHLCPMIFQELVPKQLELRVTIVGEKIFTAAVDSQMAESSKVDWRLGSEHLTWIHHALPLELEHKLLVLLRRFGIGYAAVDLILTPEGRYVFLELNVNGLYNWLEDALGFTISESIAELLVKHARRKVG